MDRSALRPNQGDDSGMPAAQVVAGTPLAEYNPRFAENPYGRILPAHFFCLIAFARTHRSA
jgi:hypothetical protein